VPTSTIPHFLQAGCSSRRPTNSVKALKAIFVCNFVKNQWILMQFPLTDLEMNGTCESMNFAHLT